MTPAPVDQVALGNLLTTLFLVCKHLGLYDEQNKLVEAAASRLFTLIEENAPAEDPLEIHVARHGFLVDGDFIQRTNKNFEKFAYRMFEHGVATFRLSSELGRREVFGFLKLILRRPSETWEEGGIVKAMKLRGIESLEVTEMAESDFAFTDTSKTDGTDESYQRKSDLWDRFALSLYQSATGGTTTALPAEITPGWLAQQISAAAAGQSPEQKMETIRELARFMSTLPHETIKTYRAAAIDKLADFTNQLSPELRRLFLQNVFNLNLKGDIAEGFFGSLSDEVILEALKNASVQRQYIPPAVLSLVGKLASTRGKGVEQGSESAVRQNEMQQKIKELFRPDQYQKYVPPEYHKALAKVLSSPHVPTELADKLDHLKETLEPSNIERHVAEITLQILEHRPDDEHLKGVNENLLSSIEFCFAVADYASLLKISSFVFEKGEDSPAFASILYFMRSDRFINQVLDDARRLGKTVHDSIADLIASVGKIFIKPLLDRLASENDRTVRFFYLRCLKRLGRPVVPEAVQRLNDQRWFVLRNVLDLLRELGEPSVLGKVRPLVKHAHAKVRMEALKTCLAFGDSSVNAILLKNIEGEAEDEALNAIALARYSDDDRVINSLISILQRHSLFGSFSLSLKRAAVIALSDRAHPKAVPVFAKELKARDLLHGKEQAELKLEIVRAMERFPKEEAQEILQPVVRGGGELGEAAGLILKKIGGEA